MLDALGYCWLHIWIGLLNRVKFNLKGVTASFIAATIASPLLFSGFNAMASDAVIVNCMETPSMKNLVQVPQKFNLSSNLLKYAAYGSGKSIIYIVGKVTDVHCKPISGANVFIWHSDSDGRYAGDANYDKEFYGSGKATTDNLGNYGFVTILPGSSKGRSPLVHFLVKHAAFADLQTEMFFEGMCDGYEASELSRIPAAIKNLLTARYVGSDGGIEIYEFNITFADGAI